VAYYTLVQRSVQRSVLANELFVNAATDLQFNVTVGT